MQQDRDNTLESPDCPLCDCDQISRIVHIFHPFRIVQCANCDFWFLSPRKISDQIELFYNNASYYHGTSSHCGYKDYADEEESHRRNAQKYVRLLDQLQAPSGKLLDIGCASGHHVEIFRQFGYEAWGCDVSQVAIDEAPQERRKFLQKATIDEIDATNPFQVITCFDTLEHIYDIRSFAHSVSQKLENDGLFMFSTPNRKSFLYWFQRSNWVSFKIPEHILYFTPQHLDQLLSPYFECVHSAVEYRIVSGVFFGERCREMWKISGNIIAQVVKILGLKNAFLPLPIIDLYIYKKRF